MSTVIHNPFLIAGYESPDYFCDRKMEAKDIMDTLRNGRNIILTSPRRLGKTGLIKHVYDQLGRQDPKTTAVYIDLYPTGSLYDFTQSFASAVLGRLDIAAGTEAATLEQVFSYLKQSGKPCCIAFDEFQQIANYPEQNTEALLRSYIQDLHNVHFIFSGSRAHMLGEMFHSPKRPFYQSATEKTIGPIEEKTYYDFAADFFRRKDRFLPADVFHHAYCEYEGYTWYIQMILNRLYAKSAKVIDDALVSECVQDILNENEYYYQHLLQVYPRGQVKLVKAVAKEKKVKEITSGAFISQYGLTAASSVKSALARMTDEEIIYPTEEGYIVYDRFFGQWLDATF